MRRVAAHCRSTKTLAILTATLLAALAAAGEPPPRPAAQAAGESGRSHINYLLRRTSAERGSTAIRPTASGDRCPLGPVRTLAPRPRSEVGARIHAPRGGGSRSTSTYARAARSDRSPLNCTRPSV